MAVRTLIHVPTPARRGSVIEVRATLGHPMETGHRPDDAGRRVPRNIVTRFTGRLDDALVFSADLYPAVAANPYIAFTLRAERSGTLVLEWTGDHGFSHRESVPLVVE